MLTRFRRQRNEDGAHGPPALPPPLPASQPVRSVSELIEDLRQDTAVDTALDAIEAAPAPVKAAQPTSVGAAAEAADEVPGQPPKRSRRGGGGQPTPRRPDSGSQPTRPRRGGGTRAASRRGAADAPLTREQLVIATRAKGASPREHAEALLDYLFTAVRCEPGDEIVATGPNSMQTAYWSMCSDRHWLPLHWGGAGGVGCRLRELCGGGKTYRDVPHADRHLADGRVSRAYSKKRVYVLPGAPPCRSGGRHGRAGGNVTDITDITAGRPAWRAA